MGADVVLRGERVVVRPTVDDDLGRLRAIRNSPEVVRWWGLEDDWPFDDASVERWTILADDRVIGLLTVSEERDPQYRSAGFDIYLDLAERGQGLGPEAIRVLIRHLADARGHHRFTIDPRADNEAAVRAYRKVGFRPVGVLRRYEYDRPTGRWADGLLMDLLAEELEPPGDD